MATTGKYAAETSVPVDRSKAEIEKILKKYGASRFMYGWEGDQVVIGFEISEKRYRIHVPMPVAEEFGYTPGGRPRNGKTAIIAALEQAERQRWRALALYLKAVLEAAEIGIKSIENSLLSDLVLMNNATVGAWLVPQIENSYRMGVMPPMLPGGNYE
jgi:hypothetical protein